MYVYIAGPYSSDPVLGTRNAVAVGDAVRSYGHAPYIPHLNLFWQYLRPHQHDYWLKLDFEWLRKCDAVLRLPGESPGADAEEIEAKRLGIPVYYSLPEFLKDYPGAK